MKIVGIGVDIVKNKRIGLSIRNKKFLRRVFGKNEILNSKKENNKISYFSKRFAAKEAFAKSLGTGFRNGLNFRDIQIVNDKFGKPYFLIDLKIKNLIKRKKKVKNFDLFLSISDEKDYSIAFSMIQEIR